MKYVIGTTEDDIADGYPEYENKSKECDGCEGRTIYPQCNISKFCPAPGLMGGERMDATTNLLEVQQECEKHENCTRMCPYLDRVSRLCTFSNLPSDWDIDADA